MGAYALFVRPSEAGAGVPQPQLGLPGRLDVRQPDGTTLADQPMWTYWYLQEGEVVVDPATFVTSDGRSSAVIHLDSDQPLRDDDGRLITDEPWGIYFKPDRSSVQGLF